MKMQGQMLASPQELYQVPQVSGAAQNSFLALGSLAAVNVEGSDATEAPEAGTSPSTGGNVDETPAVTDPSGANSPTGTGTTGAEASGSGTPAPTGPSLKKLDPPKITPPGGGGGGGGGAHKVLVSWS